MKQVRNLILAAVLPISVLIGCGETQNKQTNESDKAWETADSIRALIVEPTFAKKNFVIAEYGAGLDSKLVSPRPMTAAIEAWDVDGGGRGVVPNGTFLTRPIPLKSKVNLPLEEGRT